MTEPLTADQTREVRAFVRTQVRSGYVEPSAIPEITVDYFTGSYPEDLVLPAATDALEAEVALLRAEEPSWPEVTDYDRLTSAFADLEGRGILAREDYACCRNCGTKEARVELEESSAAGQAPMGFAFFHMQDTERVVEGGPLMICFGDQDDTDSGTTKVGEQVVAALRGAGLRTDWNGSPDSRIEVHMHWLRRNPWLTV